MYTALDLLRKTYLESPSGTFSDTLATDILRVLTDLDQRLTALEAQQKGA